ncbi:ABC transporter permease subunit [Glycomyces harbinensis]|uniref:ABC-2 family transporter protein n=1 Tax=Glycomyces harbinensis TaxID=58114 RepID=A0A1G6SNJ0_9ACTN|nr:ABC transporter permease subunit [Glycomyces harbinensis]SDD17787.1 ABC-2 family transporter protein [Glycomyces harbinensis]
MNLFKSELRRILRRRLTLIFGIVMVVGVFAVATVYGFSSSTGPSEDDLAQAQAQADEMNAEFDECVADEEFFDSPEWEWAQEDPSFEGMSQEDRCDMFIGSYDYTAEDFLWTYTFVFAEESLLVLVGIAIVAGLVLMLLSSSAIGAEWSSGGMSNLLVWHPNRMRVWGVKLGAACVVCGAAVLALLALAFGLLYLVAATRGEIGTLDSVWWGDALETLGRTVVLTVGMTVLGASLAMLGRHTAIAGGVIAGYLVVGDMLVGIAGMALKMPFPDRLSLYTWVMAWIEGRMELYDQTSESIDSMPDVMVITATDAGLLLGGIILGFALLATWAFQRRDVT